MAVPALELKPRQTIALFDAALRLCARSSGVWSLTLPADDAVSVLDARSGALLSTIAVGRNPRGFGAFIGTPP